jgi:hypothetical protein
VDEKPGVQAIGNRRYEGVCVNAWRRDMHSGVGSERIAA